MKLKEKKVKLFTISAICVMLIVSCKDQKDTVVSPKELFSTMLQLQQIDTINADDVACFFKISSQIYWKGVNEVEKSNFAWAYISDGLTFLNLSDIKCNGEQMRDISEGIGGQYEYVLMDDYLRTINWEMSNYIGANYYKTDTNFPEIVITNVVIGDTISVSDGININYTGYCGGSSGFIEVYVNMFVKDPISGTIGEYKTRTVTSDDGNVYISPQQLRNDFPIISSSNGAYGITIQLYRSRFEVENFNGKMFVKQYETLYFNHFYLAD